MYFCSQPRWKFSFVERLHLHLNPPHSNDYQGHIHTSSTFASYVQGWHCSWYKGLGKTTSWQPVSICSQRVAFENHDGALWWCLQLLTLQSWCIDYLVVFVESQWSCWQSWASYTDCLSSKYIVSILIIWEVHSNTHGYVHAFSRGHTHTHAHTHKHTHGEVDVAAGGNRSAHVSTGSTTQVSLTDSRCCYMWVLPSSHLAPELLPSTLPQVSKCLHCSLCWCHLRFALFRQRQSISFLRCLWSSMSHKDIFSLLYIKYFYIHYMLILLLVDGTVENCEGGCSYVEYVAIVLCPISTLPQSYRTLSKKVSDT